MYQEETHGQFLYLIFKGACGLRKRIYINNSKKISINPNNEELGYNYVIPTKPKSYEILSLGKGSFAGIEILYNKTGNYKYSLEVTEENSILFQFDLMDYENERGMLENFKLSMLDGYLLQEKNIRGILKSLKKNMLLPNFPNILKNGLKQPSSDNLIKNCLCSLKKLSKSIGHPTIKKNFVLKQIANHGDSSLLLFENKSQKNIFRTRKGSIYDSLDLFHKRKNRALSLQKKKTAKIETQKLFKQITLDNLTNKQLLKNSSLCFLEKSLHKSLTNFDNKQISYETPSFSIPLVSSISS